MKESTGLHGGGQEKFWINMDHAAELSLGPSLGSYSSSSESDGSLCRKRKKCSWEEPKNIQTSIELQLKDPLPPDWEQCLDLQSGRMYYLNRRTLRKTWEWPREQKIDLELNISAPLSSDERRGSKSHAEHWKKESNPSSNMVAVPCLKCHLLVMLYTSSPSCPNCKYVHSLPALQSSPSLPPPSLSLSQSNDAATKPLETLSLLN